MLHACSSQPGTGQTSEHTPRFRPQSHQTLPPHYTNPRNHQNSQVRFHMPFVSLPGTRLPFQTVHFDERLYAQAGYRPPRPQYDVWPEFHQPSQVIVQEHPQPGHVPLPTQSDHVQSSVNTPVYSQNTTAQVPPGQSYEFSNQGKRQSPVYDQFGRQLTYISTNPPVEHSVSSNVAPTVVSSTGLEINHMSGQPEGNFIPIITTGVSWASSSVPSQQHQQQYYHDNTYTIPVENRYGVLADLVM